MSESIIPVMNAIRILFRHNRYVFHGIYLLAIALLAFNCLKNALRAAYALEQVKVMYQLKHDALKKSKAIKESVDLIIQMYPSGSVQNKGTHLDCIIEIVRSNVIQDLQENIGTESSKINP